MRRVEKRVEKVGDGVFLDGLGEAQQPQVGLEHRAMGLCFSKRLQR